MKPLTFLLVAALTIAAAACGKKEDPAKPTTAGLPASATTPGTPPAGTAPGSTTQPTSAEPSTDKPMATGYVTPRNYMLGNAIGPDKKVTVATDTITTKEIAYVSLDLYGLGEAKVRALWSQKDRDGKLQALKSDSETVKYSAPMSLEFHLGKPEGGLAPGDYEVEVLVNEITLGKKKFKVK